MKASLDEQMRLAAQQREIERDEVKKIGARIQHDVESYEAELVVKK